MVKRRGLGRAAPKDTSAPRRLGERAAPRPEEPASGRANTDRRTKHNKTALQERAQLERRREERRNAERPPTPLEKRLGEFRWMTAFARECEAAGGQLWIHGGVMRDPQQASDLDLMVPGLDEGGVMRALRRAGITGRRATHHPVIRTFRGPMPVEISAEPDLLTPADIELNVHTRDFTVNAAAQRYRGQYQLQAALRAEECLEHPQHDEDMRRRVLRPCLRGEAAVVAHPLLLARAARLCGQLGFSPSAGLTSLAHLHAASVTVTPLRRRAEELMRGLSAPHWTCALPILGPELMGALVVIAQFTPLSALRDHAGPHLLDPAGGLKTLADWARAEGLTPAQVSAWSARGAWTVDAQLAVLTAMQPTEKELSGWMNHLMDDDARDHPTWKAQHAGTGLKLAGALGGSLARRDLNAIKEAQDEAQEQYPQAERLTALR